MSKKDNCRCPICDTVGKWENVDKYRLKPEGMHICTNCGFVFYPEKYMSEDEAKLYYANDYRQPPSIGNAYTGQRKLNMHSHFLNSLMSEWKEDKKENPIVCDVGAAYGMFLNWFRTHFKDGEYYGTEFAEAYRRNAWHEYQIKLDKDFDKTKKYDLISSFKVAEHQLDVDIRLREYVEALKEDGYIYISVPTWFDKMTNFGLDGFDIEYYYHPDHINVWTQKLFETLLKKVGLEIVKFDNWMYDETYLCKRNDSLMNESKEYENIDEIKDKLNRIKQAYDLAKVNKFKEAIDIFPNYPIAWESYYEQNRAKAHKENQCQDAYEYVEKNFINPFMEACPNSLSSLRLAVDISMRYNKFDIAITYIKKALDVRPNQATFLMALSQCYRQMSLKEHDNNKKIDLLSEARNVCRYIREIDMQSQAEATNWIYQDNSKIPLN